MADNQGMFEERRQWGWYWGAWGLLALYNTTWDLALRSSRWSDWFLLLQMNVAQILVWALLGFGLLALAQRFPVEGLNWRSWRSWRVVAIHLGSCFVATLVGLFLTYLVAMLFFRLERGTLLDWRLQESFRNPQFWANFKGFLYRYFHSNYLVTLALVSAYHMVMAHRRYKKREVEAAQLERAFMHAQNQALRMQLQPHFLFNTLNSISALIHLDPETADRMIARLGDLLRLSLDQSGQQEVTLAQEAQFLERYLAIERIRFQDRLTIGLQIPEDLKAARVPSFVLQPLVENAIKHGVGASADGGHIAVRARKEEGMLCLEVQDDGPGFVTNPRPGHGIGTGNTRQRLQLLYGDRQSFELLSIPGKGTLARVRLPLSFTQPESGENEVVA